MRRTAIVPEDDTLLSVGDEVTVTAGRETYTPIRFHTFEVGPFAVTTRVRQGETGQQAFERATRFLQRLFVVEHEKKLAQFLERVRETGEETDDQSNKRGARANHR